jgi:hypothetical protein
MAEERFSKETQAILDRLKREGDLLRNNQSGNSVKALRSDLTEKFLPVFENISVSLNNLTTSLGTMVGDVSERLATVEPPTNNAAGSAATAEALGLSEEYIELQRRAAELSIQNDLADQERREKEENERKQKEADERRKKEAEERLKALKENTLTGQAISNPLGFFTKAIKAGLIGFVGFNVIRGVIDQWTDGKFTAFIEGIDYEAIGKGMKTFASFLSDSPWLAFGAAISTWAAVDFGVPLAVNAVGEALRTSVLVRTLGRMTGPEIEGAPGFMDSKKMLRAGIFGALGIGILFAGNRLKEYIQKDVQGLTDEQIKTMDMKGLSAGAAVDVATATAAGASFGMMFGPKGALVGAIVGFAYGVGKKVYDVVTRTNLEDIEVTELDEQLAKTKAAQAQQLLDRIDAGEDLGFDEAAIERLRRQAGGPTQEQIDATNFQIAESFETAQKQAERLRTQLETKSFATVTEVSGYGQGMTTYERTLSAEEFIEKEQELIAKLAAAEKEIKEIEAKKVERIEEGVAISDDFILIDRKDVGLFERRSSAQEDEVIQRRLDAFDEFRDLYEGPATTEQLDEIAKRISDGALNYQNAITIVNGGNTQTNMDNRDQSQNTNVTPAPTPKDGTEQPNGERAGQ